MSQACLNEILVLTEFDEYRDNSRNSQSVFLVVYAGNEEKSVSFYHLQQKRLYPISSRINIIIIPITSLGIINIKNMPNPTMKKEYPVKRFMLFLQSKRHIPL